MSAEVLHVPLAVYSPDVKGGVLDARPASNLDIPATILQSAGLKFEDDRPSESLLSPSRRKYFVSVTHGHFTKHVALSVERDGFKYVKNFGDICELYDVNADKYEMTNLALLPEYSDVTAKFERLLADWMEKYHFVPYM